MGDVSRCSQGVEVRLSDQEHYGQLAIGNSGLLEVRHKGVWGTVCSSKFGKGEASVFCRMLGYEGNATFELPDADLHQVRQQKGSWPIWNTLQEEGTCAGNEASIEECHKPALWEHSIGCGHGEDVVLSCTLSQQQLFKYHSSKELVSISHFITHQKQTRPKVL